MPTKRERRLQHRQNAADFLDTHSGPVMRQLAEVIHDLSEEVDGLKQFEQDAAYAAELSFRLDNALQFGDPLLEAMDGVIAFFVALGAIGIWRAVSRRDRLRAARLDRLQDRLERRGPKMATMAKIRLQRKIERLSK